MSGDIDSKVLEFFKSEALEGRLELTIPQIIKGAGLNRDETIETLERLRTNKLINRRIKGRTKLFSLPERNPEKTL